MTAFSKFFHELAEGRTCKEIVHPWTDSCWEFRRKQFLPILLGNLKFFSPMIFVPTLMKIRNLGPELIKETFVQFLMVLSNGLFIANSIIFGFCFFRQLLGEFKYLYVISVSSLLSAFPVGLLPRHLGIGHATYMFSLAAESLIRQNNSVIISWLRKSKIFGTACFMGMSSLILHFMRKMKNNAPVFWFMHPYIDKLNNKEENSKEEEKEKKCQHKGFCISHILKGIASYGVIGIGFEFVKYVIPNIGLIRKDFDKFFAGLLKKFRAPLVYFLISYVGIYRTLHCLLINRQTCSRETANLISGGMSGLSYCLVPNYNMFCIAFTSLIQLMLLDFQKQKEPNKIVKLIQSIFKIIPFRAFVFAISFAVLAHSRIFYPYSVPRLGMHCIDTESGGIAYDGGVRFAKIWMSGNH